jgi:hypothetical protein
VAARRIRVRPAVLDHLTGTIGATTKMPPARDAVGRLRKSARETSPGHEPPFVDAATTPVSGHWNESSRGASALL